MLGLYTGLFPLKKQNKNIDVNSYRMIATRKQTFELFYLKIFCPFWPREERWPTFSKMTNSMMTSFRHLLWPSHPCYTDYCVNVHIAVLSLSSGHRHTNCYFTQGSFLWLDGNEMVNVHRRDLTAWGDWLIMVSWLEARLCLSIVGPTNPE